MKRLTLFAMSLLLTLGAMAQVLTSHTEFANGNIYYFETSRGVLGATANDANLVSSARTTIDANQNNSYCQWTVYKSDDDKYYLYNLGKKMFMGATTTNNGSIPFTTKPSNDGLVFKSTTKNGYPIMFTCNTNVGAVNHSANLGTGLVYWNAGWDKTNDDGSCHKVTKIGILDDATLANIEALVLAVNTKVYYKAEVEGYATTNPNTHFGGITFTYDGTNKSITLKTINTETSETKLDISGNVSLSYTRKYRGFDFIGFYLNGESLGTAPVLTEAQKNKLATGTPLVAKFKTDGSGDVTLFYDDDPKSYRIPAIATTGTGRIIAITDYRHNLDDIGRDNHGTGTKRIDLVARTSDDNGMTWSNIQTIAAGNDSKNGSYERAFGDAAIAAVGENIVVMAAAGDVLYPSASASNPNRMARIFSSDNGVTWSIEEMTTKMYSTASSLIPNGFAAFFGSGKLAVDPNYNGTGKARIYGALLVKNASSNYNNYAVYSDDLGKNWSILGGSQNPIASADEPKIEILPNEQIVFSARRGGGRAFNIFTYTDKANNAGTWNGAKNGCDNGGSNATNGEILCIDAKKADKTPVKLLLQSQPKGGSGQYDRRDVTIWYKEVSANNTYTSSDIASNWIEGKQLSSVLSSYSTMSIQQNGDIAFFFEEAPCYGDDYTKGYSMVYLPLSVETITKGNYFGKDAEIPESITVNAVLKDANGNEFNETIESAFSISAIETALTTKHPYITLGTNGSLENIDGTYTYTNNVTLPFTVSNEDKAVWHNVYFPANTTNNGYPIYLSAASNNDVYVSKVTENVTYGNSSYNTLNNNDKISWALYSVNNTLAFVLKNKVTGKYIQVTSVESGNKQNAVYVDKIDATAFTLLKNTGSYKGEYALVASVNGTTGYLCSTSASYGYATHYNGNGHQGAWMKFTATDYEGIISQIDNAISMVGDKVGQYTLATGKVETYNTIKNAMANSGDIKLSELNTYLTQTETLLEGATTTMPATGKYYRIAYDYGTAGKLYMQSTASTVKGVEFSDADGAESIWYYDGALMSYSEGRCIKEIGNDRGLQAIGAKQNATFSLSTRASGKFCINVGSFLHANSSNGKYYSDHCGGNSCAQHDFIIEEVETLPVTISEIGYTTLFTPVALEIPAGVDAYTATINGDKLALNDIKNTIPANTGVVITGNAGCYDFAITTTDKTATSDLKGSIAATYFEEAGNYYSLSEVNNIAAFYKENGSRFLNNSHSAYIYNADSAVEAYYFNIDSTAVENVEIENDKAEIYDLAGRKIEKIKAKGIYIINGKAVLVK